MNSALASRSDRAFSSGQVTALWVLWLTYGSFYFCRSNLGLALPGLRVERGYTPEQMGSILMWMKLAYGVGQLINGQLAERRPARTLLAIGLLASAGLNVVFGLATGLYFLIFVWACNGYAQALGWPPTMRVAANWFPGWQRGRAIGIIGTGYQLCGSLTFVVAGWAVHAFGWRGALYVPAAVLAASAVHMLVFLKEVPEGTQPDSVTGRAETSSGLASNLRLTLTNPALWFVAVSLLLLDACRYGFIDWGVMHLKEVVGNNVRDGAFKYAILPLGGILGAYLAGWATDRFFAGRRPPVICALLVTLGLLSVAYDRVVHWGLGPSVVILALIGFCIFGAQVLLVGTLPVDLAQKGTAAAAVGFVNFMGYMGAAAGDKLTGSFVKVHGWRTAIVFWACCAWLAAAAIACLWKAAAKSGLDREQDEAGRGLSAEAQAKPAPVEQS